MSSQNVIQRHNDQKKSQEDEKPCCSKSIVESINKVQVTPSDAQSGDQFSANTPPFSDTVLCIIPKLPHLDEENEQGEPQNPTNPPNQNCDGGGTPQQISLITRKPPKVSLVSGQASTRSRSLYLSDSEVKAGALQTARLNDENVIYDCNNNPCGWPSKSERKLLETASYLFHNDRRIHLENTLNLLPRERQYAVFSIFGEFARIFGYRSARKKAKHVNFPEEVMQHYEEKGDVAGKGRFVPAATGSFKEVTVSTRKRKLSAVYSSWSVKEADFVPRIDRIDDYSKLEHLCERKCVACDCFTGSKKPDVTSIMDGFVSDLNVASIFIQGHASRTYDSALGTLEFAKVKRFSTSGDLASGLQRTSGKDKLGILSSSIWALGYCLRTILEQAMDSKLDHANIIPSENGFRKILEQFASLCLSMMENVKIVLQYSHNFYNFCKECFRILRVLQIHVGFRAEFRIQRPLKRGNGLELNKTLSKRDIKGKKAVKIMVARSAPSDSDEIDSLEWKNYEDINGFDKVSSLRHLLNATSEGVTLVQTQLRFLLDDIVDSVKDVTEADLLFILGDMHDRIKCLENVGSRHIKTEMEQISRLMTDFCKDFQTFVDLGQHIMKRFVELRDVIHVTHDFLIKGLHVEHLAEMLPSNAFRKKLTLFGFCGSGVRSTKRIVEKHQPKYQPLDFFRIYYMEAINKNCQIQANRYYFSLEWSDKKIGSIFPLSKVYNWGESDGSPRESFDEFADVEAEDENEIKPILLASPVTSPRASISIADSDDEFGLSN